MTSTDQELGKSVGSDRVNEKSTFVTVLGLECSRALVEELTGQAGAGPVRLCGAGLPPVSGPGAGGPQELSRRGKGQTALVKR